MSISTDDFAKILEAGGGLTLDAGTKSKDELVQIATAAAGSEAGVIFRNVTALAVDDLVEIAAAGDGCITFEF
jgi:DNA replication protein